MGPCFRRDDDSAVTGRASVPARRAPFRGDFRSLYVSFTRLWRYHYAMTSPPIRQPVRIIGIDPGLRRTGWGVIETEGNRLVFIGCGSVEPPDDLPLASRLLAIHEGLAAVLGDFRPAE